MFERGLFLDGNWISNGEAFRYIGFIKNVDFISRFMEDKDKATIELKPMSKTFLFDDNWQCIIFSSDEEFILVQVKNLELVGVNLEYIDEYQFWMNPETYLIYVYDPDFIGGTLPIYANGDKIKPAYPGIK